MRTATEQMIRQDRRRMRAISLVAAVMNKLDPFLDHEQDRNRRDAYDALFELFHSEGVDVITDRDRADAGLPPRGEDGWTTEELVALERYRFALLTRPIYAEMPPK